MSVPRRVLVVGTGLLGASLGLALRRAGADVLLRDRDPGALALAVSLGAGRVDDGSDADPADLAVVAVPPAATAAVVADLLASGAARAVTDVASVKASLAGEVRERAGDRARRYVGGHPMAGRELSGPGAARSDLFEGRAWAVCPRTDADDDAVVAVESLVAAVGATPLRLAPEDHDAAVALVSHAPHLVASLVAARLAGAPAEHVVLAGPGIADVTRVAAGDPALWRDILSANAGAVADVLADVRDDLDAALAALRDTAPASGGAVTGSRALEPLLRAGNAGRARLPGKHGGRRTEFATVPVVVDDRPGQLGALFGDIGTAGANIEDVRIEHSPGQPVGLVEIAVRPDEAAPLVAALRAQGWTVHG